MSANIAQVYAVNPTTFLNDNDLIYIGQNGTTDSAIKFIDLSNELGGNLWLAGSGGSGAINDFFSGNAGGASSFAFFGQALNTGSIAIGIGTFSDGIGAVALGNNTQAATGGNQANYSFACGQGCLTGVNGNADYSFAFGNGSTTSGNYCFAFGNDAVTSNIGSVVWGDSNASPNTDSTANQFNLTFANGYRLFGGALSVSTIGSGLRVAEGTNAKQGISTLVAGTVVVSNTSVTANSRIFLTPQNNSGTASYVYVSARTVGTSFTITSGSALDTRDIAWQIFEPA